MGKRVDSNQRELVILWRFLGGGAFPTFTLGKGAPDYFFALGYLVIPIEFKVPGRKRSLIQLDWAKEWKGFPVVVIEDKQDIQDLHKYILSNNPIKEVNIRQFLNFWNDREKKEYEFKSK